MYYRRKIILALLQAHDNKLSPVDLQEYLFLLTRDQKKTAFEFVPYHLVFSFQSYADIRALIHYEQIKEVQGNPPLWEKIDDTDYISNLKPEDQELLQKLKKEFQNHNQKRTNHIYKNYPFFTIHSEDEHKRSQKVLEKIRNQDEYKLFTIGYEGISIDVYLDLLIANGVRLLCDVRRNPLSRKYGFSKNQLSGLLEKFNIDYIHIPELGIESDKRRTLNSREDYEKLFHEYEKTNLPKNSVAISKIIQLTESYKRVALTCFEADSSMCHRGRIANCISKHSEWSHEIEHLGFLYENESFNNCKNISEYLSQIYFPV